MSEAKKVTATKAEPGTLQLVLILFAISAAVALVLGIVNLITAPVIAANEAEKQAEAMALVLAADEYVPVDYTGDDSSVDSVYQAGDAGYVVQVSPAGSFSGTLTIMVGVDTAGAVTGVEIVTHAETSGLGAEATKADWREQFVGASGTVAVTADGGSIDALTGATITSRAVANGVTSAIAAAQSMG